MSNPSLITSTDSQASLEKPISPVFSSTRIVSIRVYKRRLWMLFIFSFLSLLCGMLFSLYPSVANVTICYYKVSENAVNWTSLLHMVVYIIFVFPVTWLINYVGLRKSVLLASLVNTLSCAIQFATLSPDTFAYVMLSMFFASISNTFVLGLPPFVASTWFPRKELSRACAFGVSGNMLGIAVGFVYSPLLMSDDCSDIPLITEGKRNIAYSLTGVNIIVLLILLISFQNAPEHPPSTAEAHRLGTEQEPYKRVIMRLLCNWNFFLISMVYGIVIGLYYSYSTSLNDLLVRFFPNKNVDIGWLGLLLTVSGLVGSIVSGYVLDYTGRFKETFWGICILSFLTSIVSSCLLHVKLIWVEYLTITLFGFFLVSMFPVGLEYGIEVAYPESEIVITGLMNGSTMIFGIILTEIVSYALDSYGDISSNVVYGVCFLICCIVTGCMTRDYRRSKRNAEDALDERDDRRFQDSQTRL